MIKNKKQLFTCWAFKKSETPYDSSLIFTLKGQFGDTIAASRITLSQLGGAGSVGVVVTNWDKLGPISPTGLPAGPI